MCLLRCIGDHLRRLRGFGSMDLLLPLRVAMKGPGRCDVGSDCGESHHAAGICSPESARLDLLFHQKNKPAAMARTPTMAPTTMPADCPPPSPPPSPRNFSSGGSEFGVVVGVGSCCSPGLTLLSSRTWLSVGAAVVGVGDVVADVVGNSGGVRSDSDVSGP